MSKILIIGPGAVGLTIAARLQIDGYPITLLGKRQDSHLQKKQFSGWNEKYSFEIRPVPADVWPCFDMVFIAVKAFQLDQVLDAALPKLRPGCVIIPVTNGATQSIIEGYQNQFPELILRLGFCMFGTSSPDNQNYRLTSQICKLYWGAISTAPSADMTSTERNLLASDRDVFFNFLPDVYPGLMKKWIFNTVMNTLCARQRFPLNKLLLDDWEQTKAVYTEAFALHAKLWENSPLGFGEILAELIEFITITGDNSNSMYRDMAAGRPTESAFLAGMALKYEGFPLLKALHAHCAMETLDKE